MLTDYQTEVTQLVRDDANRIAADDLARAITAALLRYSADRPRTKVEDVAGVTGQTMALPPGWQAGYSVLRTLEYPAGQIPPSYIEADRWGMYDAPTGQVTQLQDALPAAGVTVRANYTIAHVLDDTTDTIPMADRKAVASYAASLLCAELSSFYANQGDSTIQADSVQSQSRSDAYAKRARDLRKFYNDSIGVEDKQSAAAGTVVSISTAARRQTFFHRTAP